MRLQANNFEDLLIRFEDIDRYTPLEKLPEDCVHLHKEVFKYRDYIIKKTNYKKNKNKDSYLFDNEARWLKYLQKYTFVPKFYGKYYLDNNIYLVMEYVNGISLDKTDGRFLKEFGPYYNLLAEKLYKVLDVFVDEDITHKDLRPNNIIINSTATVFKIIDFQFCSFTGQDIQTNNELQAEHYRQAIKNVGGNWRMPKLQKHDFDTDRYAVEKILEDLKLNS